MNITLPNACCYYYYYYHYHAELCGRELNTTHKMQAGAGQNMTDCLRERD